MRTSKNFRRLNLLANDKFTILKLGMSSFTIKTARIWITATQTIEC